MNNCTSIDFCVSEDINMRAPQNPIYAGAQAAVPALANALPQAEVANDG